MIRIGVPLLRGLILKMRTIEVFFSLWERAEAAINGGPQMVTIFTIGTPHKGPFLETLPMNPESLSWRVILNNPGRGK